MNIRLFDASLKLLYCTILSYITEGLEEEGYTVSPLDSDFRVRYIVDVERENYSKSVQGNQDVDAHAGNYYQQDDVYNQDSNLLEDYYSSSGLGNLPAAVADPGSILSPSPGI